MTEQLEDAIYKDGFESGKRAAYSNRENADGCNGCKFEDMYEWELPCSKCARNCKDYWRS